MRRPCLRRTALPRRLCARGRTIVLEPTVARSNEGDRSDERMTLDQLVALTDEQALVRLGLELMEAFARAEGRSLWH